MRVFFTAAVLCLILIASMPAQSSAQTSGTIQATATVVPAILVTGNNNLMFGDVRPGVLNAIDKTDIGSAGEWLIEGESSAEITIDFALPTNLISGANSLPIDFAINDASIANGIGADQSSPSAIINPRTTSTYNLGNDGTMTVWLGGAVTPSVAQEAGAYIADIQLTVNLTGN